MFDFSGVLKLKFKNNVYGIIVNTKDQCYVKILTHI
uniref:Uncharacterized protein n=1 Tax=viral metagenome TaxID=1070528 RepID=A0A6C0JB80_9ZZZZ